MRILPLILAAACAPMALPAAAQALKPGLWEMQHKVKGNAQMDESMAEMQKEMASMPPDQRRQMEAMMASRGVQMAPAAGGGMRMKMCMTREMAERNEIPANRGECKTGQQQRSGNTMKMTFSCTNPSSTGDTQVTFNGPDAYTTRTNVTSTVNGKPETMTMEGSGKWLSADCGSVKPMQQAR